MFRSRIRRVWGHAAVFAWSDQILDRSRKPIRLESPAACATRAGGDSDDLNIENCSLFHSRGRRYARNDENALIILRHFDGGGKDLRCSSLGFLVVLFPIFPHSAFSAMISGTTPLLQIIHCMPPHAPIHTPFPSYCFL